MELELPKDFGTPYEGDDTDFSEWLDAASMEFDQLMSSWGWAPTLPLDPTEDALLSLEQAVCLPEFGGTLYLSVKASVPSPTVSIKMLRAAITSGALAHIRPNKNIFITRRDLKEWMQSCLVAKSTKVLSSANANRATMPRASSPTAAPFTSTTAGTTLRQDAVSAMIENMRKPSKPQS